MSDHATHAANAMDSADTTHTTDATNASSDTKETKKTMSGALPSDIPLATPKVILIVEDDASIGDMLMRAVSEETIHRAHLVSTGPQAVELAKTVHPALFILDYHLPMTNGLELYDRLHEIEGLEHVPTILTTAGVMEHDIGDRDLVGISKPIDLNKLLDIIEEFLD